MSADQPLRSVPFGQPAADVGGGGGVGRASAKETPASSISHTFVTGGSLERARRRRISSVRWRDAFDSPSAVGARRRSAGRCAGGARWRARCGGRACAVIAGGCTAVGAGLRGGLSRAARGQRGDQRGQLLCGAGAARERGRGRGPTAAPTRTPMASMAAASATLVRGRGRARRALAGARGGYRRRSMSGWWRLRISCLDGWSPG